VRGQAGQQGCRHGKERARRCRNVREQPMAGAGGGDLSEGCVRWRSAATCSVRPLWRERHRRSLW